MASIQEVCFPVDHQLALAKMKKEKAAATCHRTMEVKNEGTKAFQAYTDAAMLNRTPGDVKYYNCRDFSGRVIGSYHDVIQKNGTLGFIHKGVNTSAPKGSKGAVVYWGNNHNGDGEVECGWILAWHTPIGGSQCKAYVECGTVANYSVNIINWDVIEQKLDNSSNRPFYKDYNTGAEASAEITFAGDTADLFAFFKVSN